MLVHGTYYAALNTEMQGFAFSPEHDAFQWRLIFFNLIFCGVRAWHPAFSQPILPRTCYPFSFMN